MRAIHTFFKKLIIKTDLVPITGLMLGCPLQVSEVITLCYPGQFSKATTKIGKMDLIVCCKLLIGLHKSKGFIIWIVNTNSHRAVLL